VTTFSPPPRPRPRPEPYRHPGGRSCSIALLAIPLWPLLVAARLLRNWYSTTPAAASRAAGQRTPTDRGGVASAQRAGRHLFPGARPVTPT
jgi:hypothetical protein